MYNTVKCFHGGGTGTCERFDIPPGRARLGSAQLYLWTQHEGTDGLAYQQFRAIRRVSFWFEAAPTGKLGHSDSESI